jgi:hypothetical protein
MRRVGLALVLLSLGLIGVVSAVEWTTVDRCLDRGGVFHYGRGVCDFEAETAEFVPYFQRHKVLLGAVGTLAVGGLALVLIGGKQSAG